MMKGLSIGLWACVVTVAASHGMASLMQARASRPAQAPVAASEVRKTKEINVPIIRDGAVKGYLVTQLSYVVDLAVEKKLATPPDAFVVDETFRYVYTDEKIDFTHLDKLELEKMTRDLIQKVNSRMKADVITEMGIQECNFFLAADTKNKI
jgi:hypothetical protein